MQVSVGWLVVACFFLGYLHAAAISVHTCCIFSLTYQVIIVMQSHNATAEATSQTKIQIAAVSNPIS